MIIIFALLCFVSVVGGGGGRWGGTPKKRQSEKIWGKEVELTKQRGEQGEREQGVTVEEGK